MTFLPLHHAITRQDDVDRVREFYRRRIPYAPWIEDALALVALGVVGALLLGVW